MLLRESRVKLKNSGLKSSYGLDISIPLFHAKPDLRTNLNSQLSNQPLSLLVLSLYRTQMLLTAVLGSYSLPCTIPSK